MSVPREVSTRLVAMGRASETDDVTYPFLNLLGTAAATFDDSLLADDNIAELKERIAAEQTSEHGHVSRIHSLVLRTGRAGLDMRRHE